MWFESTLLTRAFGSTLHHDAGLLSPHEKVTLPIPLTRISKQENRLAQKKTTTTDVATEVLASIGFVVCIIAVVLLLAWIGSGIVDIHRAAKITIRCSERLPVVTQVSTPNSDGTAYTWTYQQSSGCP